MWVACYRLDYFIAAGFGGNHQYECHGEGWPDHIRWLDPADNLIIWIEWTAPAAG